MKTFLFFAHLFFFSTLLLGAPEPTLDITHVCNGDKATINYSYEGEDYYFGWHFEGQEPFLTVPGAGTIEDAPIGQHTVTLYVPSKGGYTSYSYIIDVHDITPTFNWVEGNTCNGVMGDATAKVTLHRYNSNINYTAYLKNPGGQVLLAANMTSSTHTFTNLPTGNYLLEIQSNHGACSHIKSVAIYDEDLSATVSAGVGTCTTLGGDITVNLPNFKAGETYDISVKNTDNFQVINYQQTTANYTLANVAPGNYQVTIHKGNCEKTLFVTVEVAGVQAITSIYFDGGCYWKFNATMLGGATATSYTWDLVDALGNAVTTGITYSTVDGDEIFIPTTHNSVAGTLTVTTTDGCTYTANLDYPSTDMFLSSGIPSHTVTDNLCGASIGSILVDWSMLSPNPFMEVYEVKLYNGTTLLSTLSPNGNHEIIFENLNTGTYKVELHARGNCNTEGIVTINNIIVAENTSTLRTFNTITCDNGALAELSVLAHSDAVISWAPTGGNPIPNATGSSYTVLNPSNSSHYTVTVTESNGCTSTADFTIQQMNFPGPEVIEPIRCGSPGTYQLWLPGTTPSNPGSPFAPYTVTINGETTSAFSHGQASQAIEVDTVGYYPVIITSVNTGCQMTFNTYIGAAGLDVNFTEIDPSNCTTNNGSLAASTNSGFGPYTYLWNTGAQTQSITGLSLGATYTVTITDINGCTGTKSFTFNKAGAYGDLIVGAPNGQGSIWNNGPACTDNATLLASFNGTSPPSPLTYTWSLATAGNTPLATGFGTGIHSVTVTDANFCTYTATSPELNTGWQYPTPQEVEQFIDCANNQFGFYFDYNAYWGCPSLDIEIYEHDASIDGSTSGSDAFKTLIHTTTVQQNGSHTVWVPMNNALDPNTRIEIRFASCCNPWYWQRIHNLNFSLPEPTITVLPASCTSSGDVLIEFPTTSYTAPHQTVWHDGVVSNHRTDLPAGTYLANIQHQQGCRQQELIHIPGASGNPKLIQANSCQQSISLAATNITGGTANYSLRVNGVPTAVGTVLTGIGSYILEITDANGCVGTEPLSIYAETYNATAETTAPSCELTDGKIQLHVNNNVSGIASYEWTGPGASSYMGHTLNGLAAGNYTYTVTDNRGCELSNSVTLPTNTTISLGLLGGCLPQVTNITGGTAPYRLVFEADLTQNPNPTQTSFGATLDDNTTYPYDLNALDQGAYNVYVTDKHGCQVGPYTLNTLPTSAPTRNLNLLHMRWKRLEVTATTDDYREADVIKDDLVKQSQNFLDDLDALDGLADHCERQTTDQLDAQFEQSLHHYTLYYYNIKDQLVRTVPPAGVDFINNNAGTDLNDLIAFRQGSSSQPSKLIPEHHQVTQYDYNALGQMVKTNTPDKGIGTSLYTEDGLVRFSQDAKQVAAATPTYSYTLYDALKRVVEIGEMSCPTTLTQADVDALNLDQLPATSTKDEHIKTFYSIPHKVAGTSITYYGLPNKQQRYLRNNVSYTESHQNGTVVTTSYSYDVHGNVEWIRQDIPGLGENYIAYDYDLLTKTIQQVRYNEYSEDRFFHKYTYDEQKRLKETYTSRDGIIWDKDANYDYYAHGPLKRKELGEDKIQGLDYVYTIHGWIKSVNNPLMDQYGIDPSNPSTNDVGKDGYENAFMKDVFGFALGYYEEDFTRGSFGNLITYGSQQLYNGNISYWSNGANVEALTRSLPDFPSPNREGITQRNFTYDEVNRIKTSDFLVSNTPLGDESLPTMFVAPNKYNTSYSYDGNGNLQQLSRYGNNNLIDNLTYNYGTNDLKNRLNSVEDAQGNQGVDDLEALQSYLYDEIGNLRKSTTPIAANGTTEVMDVFWRVDGKVDYVTVAKGGTTSQINFLYDASGNRVAKIWDPNIATNNDEISTYHVRDATGNILATYSKTYNGTAFEKSLKERTLFGSSRLGIDKKTFTFVGTQDIVRSGYSILEGLQTRTISDKLFELSDHLGNVTTTLSDYKLKTGTGYEANLLSYQQYYPFGWTMPKRQANAGNYRFGFNGMEKNPEINSGSYTTHYRQLDTRIGRWLSIDPIAGNYPSMSPYVAMGNSPIYIADPRGDSIPTEFYNSKNELLTKAPDKVDYMYKSEYGIEVGYNAETKMLFYKGSTGTSYSVSPSARKAMIEALTDTRTGKKARMKYGVTKYITNNYIPNDPRVKVQEKYPGEVADQAGGGVTFGGTFFPFTSIRLTHAVIFMNLDYYNDDLEMKYLNTSKLKNFNQRSYNMARVYEEEFLAHVVGRLSDPGPFHGPFAIGGANKLVNKFRTEMGLSLRLSYGSFGFPDMLFGSMEDRNSLIKSYRKDVYNDGNYRKTSKVPFAYWSKVKQR